MHPGSGRSLAANRKLCLPQVRLPRLSAFLRAPQGNTTARLPIDHRAWPCKSTANPVPHPVPASALVEILYREQSPEGQSNPSALISKVFFFWHTSCFSVGM